MGSSAQIEGSIHTHLGVQLNPLQPLFAEWIKKLLWFLLPNKKTSEETIDSSESIKNAVREPVQSTLRDPEGDFAKSLNQKLQGPLPKTQQGPSPLQGQQ